MIVRRSRERGAANHGWLDTRHTFSFADYWDPAWMGFRALRVLNEDRVAPGAGFPTHGHADMEILSYVLEGELAHKDSMGTGSVLRPGELQRMSAGTGVRHSEFNGSEDKPVHFLQIWLIPDRRGHQPGYEQKAFPEAARKGRLQLVASPDGADGSLTVHQDARVSLALLGEGERVTHAPASGRSTFVHVVRGAVTLNGTTLGAGDAAGFTPGEAATVEVVGAAAAPAEIMLFDLA